jgi:hypothetical protein
MAIIKSMQSKYGLALHYHRITSINLNYQHHKVILCVASYLSKEARASKCIPLEEIDIEVPASDTPLFQGPNPLYAGYQWLKENVIGFEDSLDDWDVVEPVVCPVVPPDEKTNP